MIFRGRDVGSGAGCWELHLDFGAEGEVAGVPQSGYDIAFGGELIVDGAAPDPAVGFASQDKFYPHGAGDGYDDMDFGRMSLFPEVLDGFDEGGPGRQHGIGNDDDP